MPGRCRREMRHRAKRTVQSVFRTAGFTLERADPAGITLIEHLRALLPRLGVDVVIDVGAHQGEYARRVRDAGFRGRIVSIEPARANFDALALASRGDDAWEVHHLALGRARGRMSLHV